MDHKMNKQLWIIDYENTDWCGGQLNVLVWAETADDAVAKAEAHMVEEQLELFGDHYDEDKKGAADECPFTVNSVAVMNENH